MGSMRQAVEDQVISLLKAGLLKSQNPTAGYLFAVDPYNGELDEAQGSDDLRRILMGRMPSLLVSASSGSLTSKSSQRTAFFRSLTVDIIAVSNHMRTRENRNRQDVVSLGSANADPGIYQIAEDVFRILAGTQLGTLEAGPMMPVREEVILQLKDMTVWRLGYAIDTAAYQPTRDDGDGVFLEYRIDGNVADPSDPTVATNPPNPLAEADGSL